MVQLIDSDIQTREVLQWQGVHLLHFHGSSCSQKLRIYLNLKDIEWSGREVVLPAGENFTPWYLGINPRGLIPTLVIDGEVHIESNDILLTLEQRFPEPVLIPPAQQQSINTLLKHEDDLHMDLRTLTFRYTQKRPAAPKSEDLLQQYQQNGSGEVAGITDVQREREIRFWRTVAQKGISDDAIRASVAMFYEALTALDARLTNNLYLLADELTVLDIAWYVYCARLNTCGYPVALQHPNVGRWFDELNARDEFKREVTPPAEVAAAIAENHARQKAAGELLVDVVGW